MTRHEETGTARAGAGVPDLGGAVETDGVAETAGAFDGENAISPTATAWAQRAPVDWFSGQAQRVSTSVAERAVTLTRNMRLPTLTAPCQPDDPPLAALTAPESARAFPSLKAFQDAAERSVDSDHSIMWPGCKPHPPHVARMEWRWRFPDQPRKPVSGLVALAWSMGSGRPSS